MTIHTFYCSYCNRIKSHKSDSTTGYAIYPNGEKICFDCCAIVDRDTMVKTGHSKNLPLYLCQETNEVTNWCGTLRFVVHTIYSGKHNMAGTRYDVWFAGPDGHEWHGVQYGEWTQICHCKRTKKQLLNGF